MERTDAKVILGLVLLPDGRQQLVCSVPLEQGVAIVAQMQADVLARRVAEIVQQGERRVELAPAAALPGRS